jgi:hypothetical protein
MFWVSRLSPEFPDEGFAARGKFDAVPGIPADVVPVLFSVVV